MSFDKDDPIAKELSLAFNSIIVVAGMMAITDGIENAFRSMFISGIRLGAEIAIGDVVAGRQLNKWLYAHLTYVGLDEQDREFIDHFRKTLMEAR